MSFKPFRFASVNWLGLIFGFSCFLIRNMNASMMVFSDVFLFNFLKLLLNLLIRVSTCSFCVGVSLNGISCVKSSSSSSLRSSFRMSRLFFCVLLLGLSPATYWQSYFCMSFLVLV